MGLNPEERTVAELLKDAGYATGCIGKWHLGDQPEFLPTRQGFDYYLGLPYSNDMGPAEDGAKSNLGDPIPAPKASPGNARNDETGLPGSRQPPLPLLENEKVVERVRQKEQAGIVERYTTAAVKFIRANQDKPFFLYLPHTAVHFPLYPGEAFQGKSHERHLRRLGRGSGLERRPGARHAARAEARRPDAGALHLRQRRHRARGERAVARLQGQHVGRRHARADHRLVARQDPRRHAGRRHHRHDRHPAHVREPGRGRTARRPQDRRRRHLAAAGRRAPSKRPATSSITSAA